MHNMTISDARGVLTRCYTIPAKGDNIRKVFPELGIFNRRTGGEKFDVLYARGT